MFKNILKITLPTLLILALFVGFTSFVQAEDDSTTDGAEPELYSDDSDGTVADETTDTTKPGVLDSLGNVVQDRAQKLRDDVNAVRATFQEKKAETQAEMEAKRLELQGQAEAKKAEMEAKREELQGNAVERKAEMETKKAEVEANMTERRAELEAKKEERQAAIKEEMSQRARAYIERTVKRFEAAIERVSGAITRVESRITKIQEERGEIDTTEASAFLISARSELVNAQASLASANGAVETALASENPKEAFGSSVKSVFEETKTYIKNAHGYAVDAISSLKNTLGNNKLEVCPEDWYEDKMPTVTEDGETVKTPREYFILDGKRREASEFNLSWVKENCEIEKQTVY